MPHTLLYECPAQSGGANVTPLWVKGWTRPRWPLEEAILCFNVEGPQNPTGGPGKHLIGGSAISGPFPRLFGSALDGTADGLGSLP